MFILECAIFAANKPMELSLSPALFDQTEASYTTNLDLISIYSRAGLNILCVVSLGGQEKTLGQKLKKLNLRTVNNPPWIRC